MMQIYRQQLLSFHFIMRHGQYYCELWGVISISHLKIWSKKFFRRMMQSTFIDLFKSDNKLKNAWLFIFRVPKERAWWLWATLHVKIRASRQCQRGKFVAANRLLIYSVSKKSNGWYLNILAAHCECKPGYLKPLLARAKEDRRISFVPSISYSIKILHITKISNCFWMHSNGNYILGIFIIHPILRFKLRITLNWLLFVIFW